MKTLLLIAMLAVPATGCEKAAADRPAAQPVAKVNGTKISIQQIRAAPAYAGAGPAYAGAGPAPADAGALEKVIDRELLVQQALAAKLDRDPQVVQSIENARRQLLAQAYLERAASAASGSTRDEVRAFYEENPALFAERRVYRLRELVVSAPAEMVDVLRAEAAKVRDLEELAAWLRARNAGYSTDSLTQPAEQLPLTYLPQLARMKAGEIAVFATPSGASVMQLVQVEAAPLTESQAAPLIEQFLAGRRRLETAAAEVKRLREVATIEYLGEFKRGN
jgi:EpsD family peptidyl-prolyl cis-trans isomerase